MNLLEGVIAERGKDTAYRYHVLGTQGWRGQKLNLH